MDKLYLNLAASFEELATSYRKLAEQAVNLEPSIGNKQVEQAKSISIEAVRAVLAEKSRDGKTSKIKALLLKYDAGKLSGVKPEDYAALLAEAEVL